MSFTPHLALVAYTSELAEPLPRDTLDPLLSRWRVANAERGVTGLLLIHERSCFQAIEGFPDVIEALYAHIARDPRHAVIAKLIHRQTDRRWFGDWSLGLGRVVPADLAAIPRLELLAAPGAVYGSLDWVQAETLVEAFGDGYWRRTIG